MSTSDQSFNIRPHWLRDEANRLAQTASPEQQNLTVEWMTPLMSDVERNTSLSPPSKGLTAPLEPLFGMAYLNNSEREGCQTPRRLRSGRNSAFTTPTRRTQNQNNGSPATRVSSHRSSPLSAEIGRPIPHQADAFPPKPATRTMPTTALNESVEQPLPAEFWNEDETRGFWTLTDDEGYKWIVKYFTSNQEYRAWTGIESGYDDKGLAFSRKRGHGSEYRRIASQSTISGDSEESDHDQIETGRSSRKRNIDQIHPYSTEKTNYKRSKDGKKKQNFKRQYTSDREISGPRSSTKMRRPNRSNGVSRMEPKSQRSSAQIKPSSKSRLASGSVERKVTPPPSPEPASLEMIQNSTTLYIFTNSAFEAPPVPIYLKSCKDVDSFFSIVLLVAGVQERDIRLITVKFDWLPESKPNTIQMIRGLSDSYDKMMEEIRAAPAWERGGGGKVNVSINVVFK